MRRTFQLSIAAISLAGLVIATAYVGARRDTTSDAHAYWIATQPGVETYVREWFFGADAFVYSPAFLQAIRPLGLLDWPMFHASWTALLVVALAVTVDPRWAFVALTFGIPLRGWPVWESLLYGNIELLFVLAIALGFRYPAAWSFVILTKVTPGIGLVWFAARREWRSLLVAVSATAAISAVSFVAEPNLWRDWIRLLMESSYRQPMSAPLWLRVILGGFLVYCGAKTDARWTVPIGVLVAHPAVWLNSLAIPLVLVPLLAAKYPRTMFGPIVSSRG